MKSVSLLRALIIMNVILFFSISVVALLETCVGINYINLKGFFISFITINIIMLVLEGILMCIAYCANMKDRKAAENFRMMEFKINSLIFWVLNTIYTFLGILIMGFYLNKIKLHTLEKILDYITNLQENQILEYNLAFVRYNNIMLYLLLGSLIMLLIGIPLCFYSFTEETQKIKNGNNDKNSNDYESNNLIVGN